MVSLGALVRDSKSRFKHANIESFALDAELLMAYVLGKDRAYVIAHAADKIDPKQMSQYQALCARREQREPMAYLTGQKAFYNDLFYVNEHTLIPRPDSETLINAVLGIVGDKQHRLKILDLGTGSGCLLLTLLRELPNALGVGVDQEVGAISIAQKNAEYLGVQDRAHWVVGHWADALSSSFDIVISNPPYIRDEDIRQLESDVQDYEPVNALSGGKTGLVCYEQLGGSLVRNTKKGGVVALEFGKGQTAEVRRIMERYGLLFTSVHKDLAAIERCIIFKK